MWSSLPLMTLALVASATSASADRVYAWLSTPTSHGKVRAYGGDADSWDLWIGYKRGVDVVDTTTPVFVVASKGCWPESEYYEGTYYSFSNSPSDPQSYYDSAALQYSTACASDLSDYLDDIYGDQPYLRVDYFNDTGCTALDFVNVMIADGNCHPRFVRKNATDLSDQNGYTEAESRLVSIDDDGSATFLKFDSGDCTGNSTERYTFTEDEIDNHECVDSVIPSIASSGLSGGAIAGIVIGAFAFVGLAVWGVWFYRRHSQKTAAQDGSNEEFSKPQVQDTTLPSPSSSAQAYNKV